LVVEFTSLEHYGDSDGQCPLAQSQSLHLQRSKAICNTKNKRVKVKSKDEKTNVIVIIIAYCVVFARGAALTLTFFLLSFYFISTQSGSGKAAEYLSNQIDRHVASPSRGIRSVQRN